MAQAPANTPAAATAPPSSAELVNPALTSLHETLANLHFDKWKSGNVRGEAERNAGSIQNDLEQVLPQLLKDADAAPERVSAALPLVRNLTALYDVSLRVLDAARIAGSSDQASQMQQAVDALEGTNKALYERLQNTAAAQEARMGELEAQGKSAAPAQTVQDASTCPAPAPVKKAVRRRPKPAAAPTNTSPQTAAPAQQQPKQ